MDNLLKDISYPRRIYLILGATAAAHALVMADHLLSRQLMVALPQGS